MARRQPVTARLNGSVGESFDDGFGLLLEAIVYLSSAAAPDLSGTIITGQSRLRGVYDSATLTELSGNSTPKQR